jgi:hypothetical protein
MKQNEMAKAENGGIMAKKASISIAVMLAKIMAKQ